MPETGTLLKGNDYMDQAFYVELVSKNIPSNCRLYVKEHLECLHLMQENLNFIKNKSSSKC